MGCGHICWGRHAIERCGNPNCVQNTMEKIGEIIERLGKLVES